jgi:hypothetical protein
MRRLEGEKTDLMMRLTARSSHKAIVRLTDRWSWDPARAVP